MGGWWWGKGSGVGVGRVGVVGWVVVEWGGWGWVEMGW